MSTEDTTKPARRGRAGFSMVGRAELRRQETARWVAAVEPYFQLLEETCNSLGLCNPNQRKPPARTRPMTSGPDYVTAELAWLVGENETRGIRIHIFRKSTLVEAWTPERQARITVRHFDAAQFVQDVKRVIVFADLIGPAERQVWATNAQEKLRSASPVDEQVGGDDSVPTT